MDLSDKMTCRWICVFLLFNIILLILNGSFIASSCFAIYKKICQPNGHAPIKNNGDAPEPLALSNDNSRKNLDQLVGDKVSEEARKRYMMPELVYKEEKLYQERIPKAHLVGVKPDKAYVNGTKSPELIHMKTWRHDCDTGYKIGDVDFQDGFLKIKKTGMYYVYHGVSYIEHLQCNVSPEERKNFTLPTCKNIAHGIYKIKNDDPSEKHENIATASTDKLYTNDYEYGEYNDFIGDLVSLNEGDKVLVKVSNIDAISWNSRSNSFGAFLVK